MDRIITAKELDNWFTYHSPTLDQQHKYAAIREAAKHLATVICASCPPGADTTAAVRKVREAAMMGNQAIACGDNEMVAKSQAWAAESTSPKYSLDPREHAGIGPELNRR